MSQLPTLDGLADIISESTKAILSHLRENGLPEPSFAEDGPASLPMEVQGPRMALIEAAQEMLRLAMGPKDYIFLDPVTLHHDQMTFDVLNQFDFWSAVPVGGSIAYADLAIKVNLPEEIVRRILRYSMTNRLFAESDGKVVHTSPTRFVAQNPMQMSWMSHNLEEVATATTKVPAALRMYSQGKDEPAQELSQTGFNVEFRERFGDDVDYWKFVERDGEGEKKGYRTKQFSEAMQVVQEATPIDAVKLIGGGFDWASLGEGTVVDVGGSSGHEAIALAKQYPDLKFVVEDRPQLEQAFQANIPAEFTSRITFKAHDFFTEQPVPADVYFLKQIVHDWPDKYSIQILKSLVPAMKPGAKVIICEGVAPPIEGGDEWVNLPQMAKKMLAASDLQMLALFNAKQRSMEDYVGLFKKADARFELSGTFFLPGSAFGLIVMELKA